MKEFSSEIKEIDKNKQSVFRSYVKRYEIDRLRLIFNRLGSSESHSMAFNALLQTILSVSQIVPREQNQNPSDPNEEEKALLLRYLFYKIVFNIFQDCQEEFFSETDELQVMKLVKITCLLCQEIQEFISIFQSLYYLLCPLLIPKVFPELNSSSSSTSAGNAGDSKEKLLLSLGFTRKLKKDSQTVNLKRLK
jgi:hypothetical protein